MEELKGDAARRALKPWGGRRDTPGRKALKDRRSPRERGRMGTSVARKDGRAFDRHAGQRARVVRVFAARPQLFQRSLRGGDAAGDHRAVLEQPQHVDDRLPGRDRVAVPDPEVVPSIAHRRQRRLEALRAVPYEAMSGIGVHHANAVVWGPVYRTRLGNVQQRRGARRADAGWEPVQHHRDFPPRRWFLAQRDPALQPVRERVRALFREEDVVADQPAERHGVDSAVELGKRVQNHRLQPPHAASLPRRDVLNQQRRGDDVRDILRAQDALRHLRLPPRLHASRGAADEGEAHGAHDRVYPRRVRTQRVDREDAGRARGLLAVARQEVAHDRVRLDAVDEHRNRTHALLLHRLDEAGEVRLFRDDVLAVEENRDGGGVGR
eukprot:31459-Pelagococcus_subviridis.AAC.5